MIGIYKITSPSGKIYIGQSWNINKRFYTYKKLRKEQIGNVLFNSLKKYGSEFHTFDIIHILNDTSLQEDLDDLEKYYILNHREQGLKLLNQTEGGNGSKGYKHTNEAIEKMRFAKKGKYAGENNPNYGKGLLGKNNGMFGRKRPFELVEKLKNINSKPVVQLDKQNKIIHVYNSITEAAKSLKLQATNISSCCLNKKGYKTSGGFKWRYNYE